MKKLRHIRLFESFVRMMENDIIADEPVALAILGAPAGGKSYNKKLLTKLEELTKIARAANPNFSKDLTVDVLRGQIQKLPEQSQLELFYWGYYTLRDLAKDDNEYAKWFSDMENLWKGKLKDVLDGRGIDVEITDKGDLKLNGKSGEAAVRELDASDMDGIIGELDQYNDYKRVVRAYQLTMQKQATDNKKDIVYDESGDEPEKIIKNMAKLDKDEYVTDVIMVHHKDMINNLFQNASRMVLGSDGGRDSSNAIVQAYKDIQGGMDKYKQAAEVSVSTSTDQLQHGKGEAIKALSQANTKDDDAKGNKPIDVFVRIYGDEPKEVLDRILAELDEEQGEVFKAIVAFQVQDKSVGVPEKTRDLALEYINMDNKKALDILTKANGGELKNKYIHQHGGVTDKLLQKAKTVLS